MQRDLLDAGTPYGCEDMDPMLHWRLIQLNSPPRPAVAIATRHTGKTCKLSRQPAVRNHRGINQWCNEHHFLHNASSASVLCSRC
jgi:hypothetical protein